MDYLKEREREKQNDQSTLGWSPRVDRVGHTWTEDLCPRVAHVVLTWPPCQGLLAVLSFARTLCVLRPFSVGPPNSDFEPVFGLQIVTPIRTTKTKKLCKNVEKSSRKTTSKTTQRMRMQSSISTSFGLET